MTTTYQEVESVPISLKRNKYKDLVEEIFSRAGITVNGSRPYDIQVKNDNFYKRFLSDGTLGCGESYMDGWWESESIDELVFRLARADIKTEAIRDYRYILYAIKARLTGEGSKSKAIELAHRHFDIGNDLFQRMLDKRMTYTCAYWRGAENLDEAQENKLELICRKLGLKPGMRVLDIGCGWGCFVKYAAEKYGVSAVGVTISKEQVKLGQEMCTGLPVEIRLQDYREIKEKFDRILAMGMFEHVTARYHRAFMQIVHRCLKDDGLFLLHSVGRNKTVNRQDPWIAKYIFPNSLAPSIKQVSDSIEGLFVMEDWHNFGTDYGKTLLAWYDRFIKNWNEIKENYDERFFRMWKFYLLFCAGVFRSRQLQLWQIVFSKKGILGGYQDKINYDIALK